jgi:hypothetical protein
VLAFYKEKKEAKNTGDKNSLADNSLAKSGEK